MRISFAIVPATVLAATAMLISSAPISGTAIACGFHGKKTVTRKEATVSERDRGRCWQYRHIAGRWKRVYVCH